MAKQSRQAAPGQIFKAPQASGGGAAQVAQLLMALAQSNKGNLKLPSVPKGGGGIDTSPLTNAANQIRRGKERKEDREYDEKTSKQERDLRKSERKEDRANRVSDDLEHRNYQTKERQASEAYDTRRTLLANDLDARQTVYAQKVDDAKASLIAARTRWDSIRAGEIKPPPNVDIPDWYARERGARHQAGIAYDSALHSTEMSYLKPEYQKMFSQEDLSRMGTEGVISMMGGEIPRQAVATQIGFKSSALEKALESGMITQSVFDQANADMLTAVASSKRTAEIMLKTVRDSYALYGMDSDLLAGAKGSKMISLSGEGFSRPKKASNKFLDRLIKDKDYRQLLRYRDDPNRQLTTTESLFGKRRTEQVWQTGTHQMLDDWLAAQFPQENHPSRLAVPGKQPPQAKWAAYQYGRAMQDDLESYIEKVRNNPDMDGTRKGEVLGRLSMLSDDLDNWVESRRVSREDVNAVVGGAYTGDTLGRMLDFAAAGGKTLEEAQAIGQHARRLKMLTGSMGEMIASPESFGLTQAAASEIRASVINRVKDLRVGTFGDEAYLGALDLMPESISRPAKISMTQRKEQDKARKEQLRLQQQQSKRMQQGLQSQQKKAFAAGQKNSLRKVQAAVQRGSLVPATPKPAASPAASKPSTGGGGGGGGKSGPGIPGVPGSGVMGPQYPPKIPLATPPVI